MTPHFAIERVLCALDLAEPIDGVLETATSIASRFDAQLHLLHVWNPWVPVSVDGPQPLDGYLDTTSHALAERLDAAARRARCDHARVLCSLVPGRPWEQIVSFAESTDCDLIVAGTHGRTGIARLMNGSVAERVVRESTVPILVVPITQTGTPRRPSDAPRPPSD